MWIYYKKHKFYQLWLGKNFLFYRCDIIYGKNLNIKCLKYIKKSKNTYDPIQYINKTKKLIIGWCWKEC